MRILTNTLELPEHEYEVGYGDKSSKAFIVSEARICKILAAAIRNDRIVSYFNCLVESATDMEPGTEIKVLLGFNEDLIEE
jgi:hypothetical protein